MFNSSGPFTDKKHNPHSVAIAFAIKVFPVPGGPYKRIPTIELKYITFGPNTTVKPLLKKSTKHELSRGWQ